MEVKNVRVHSDDVNDLIFAGVNFFGPDSSLEVVFPDGTEQQDENHFVLPGGSLVSTEDNFVEFVFRTW